MHAIKLLIHEIITPLMYCTRNTRMWNLSLAFVFFFEWPTLLSTQPHKKEEGAKETKIDKNNTKNMIMERETEKKNIQVQLWMNQKDNRIANLHNLDDLQQKNKRGNSLV
jgi:hypothetical protein